MQRPLATVKLACLRLPTRAMAGRGLPAGSMEAKAGDRALRHGPKEAIKSVRQKEKTVYWRMNIKPLTKSRFTQNSLAATGFARPSPWGV